MSSHTLPSAIADAVKNATEEINVSNLKSLADDVIEKCMEQLISHVNGHAVAVWMPESKDGQEVLTIAYNVGGKGSDVEGIISQSLDDGLVSKSFKEAQVVCHKGFFKHKEQSSDVDKQLGQMTAHQMASPFNLFGLTVGAITVIQTLGAGVENHADWGFDDQDVRHFTVVVAIIQRLFELNLIRRLETLN
ncbi:MAG: hypothetical protein AAGA30_05345 [Planctomycetota bacterium]